MKDQNIFDQKKNKSHHIASNVDVRLKELNGLVKTINIT